MVGIYLLKYNVMFNRFIQKSIQLCEFGTLKEKTA